VRTSCIYCRWFTLKIKGLKTRFSNYALTYQINLALDANKSYLHLHSRGVAQSGSASGLGPEGRRFESYRPDQFIFIKLINYPSISICIIDFANLNSQI
jgi:hypothetical protein